MYYSVFYIALQFVESERYPANLQPQKQNRCVVARRAISRYGQGCETTPSPSPDGDTPDDPFTPAEGYTYVGCFGDKSKMESRDMSLHTRREFKLNKPKMCSSRCAKVAGATFFGLQNGGL